MNSVAIPTLPREFRAAALPAGPARVASSRHMGQGAPVRAEERIAELERGQADLDRALFDANWVRQQLSAPRELRRGHFEVASETFAVRHLCGDFCCISETATEMTLAIGDIAGKGMGAGMWITLFVGLFHIHAASSPDPASTMERINRDLCLLQPARPLATLFMARFDWRRGAMSYCNAGHPPALLLHADGNVQPLQEGGPILGAIPGAAFTAAHLVFKPGDTLLAYSDGLIECRNEEGNEFGMGKLVSETRRTRSCSAFQMVFSLLAAVRDFAGNQPREDDVSVMVLRDARKRLRRRPRVT